MPWLSDFAGRRGLRRRAAHLTYSRAFSATNASSSSPKRRI
jgi:hypothetical protein